MLLPVSGTFYRILYQHDLPRLLHGAHTPDARFHRVGQAAFYASPSADAARFAVSSYLQPGDSPRVIAALNIIAQIVDLRDHATLSALGLKGHEPSVHWQVERAKGLPASTWAASDAARRTSADGMIYASRSDPSRWHLVLFHWNTPGRASVTPFGPAVEFHP